MKLEKVSMTYVKDKLEVLSDIDLEINENGLYVLIGESGSGKTTLLNMLTGIITDYDGEIYFEGKNIKDIKYENMIYYVTKVAQNYDLHEYLTVYENLEILPFTFTNNEIDLMLKSLNILELKNTKTYKLSGGEKQRVAIVRALLINSPFIIFDEPTSSIDSKNYKRFINIVKKISKSKIILIITHDNRVVRDADFVYLLNNKKIRYIDKDFQGEENNE